MTETKKPEQTYKEAPRSANVQVKTANGFYWQFTMREETGKKLIEDMEAFEKVVLDRGWTPVEPRSNSFPKKPDVPTKPCPMHPDAELKEKILKDGTKLWSHHRGVYPNLEYCNGNGFPDEHGKVTAVAQEDNQIICETCGQPAEEKKGTTKGGKPYHGIFCSSGDRQHTRWLWN